MHRAVSWMLCLLVVPQIAAAQPVRGGKHDPPAPSEAFDLLMATSGTDDAALNLGFDRDEQQPNGKPDGWTIITENGARCFLAGDRKTKNGNLFLFILHKSDRSWTIIARPAADLLRPDVWYRLSFQYRTAHENPPWAGWLLMAGDFERSLNVLGAELKKPIADGAWHEFQSGPFRVPAEQVALYPFLAFRVPMNFLGSIEIDDVAVKEQ